MTTTRILTLFVVATTGAFVYISNAIPQIQSAPIVVDTEIGASAEELVSAGRTIFQSDRAQCLTCHSLGEDPKARCPNQEGLGERASQQVPGLTAPQYLIESVYNPNAFVVPGYPKNQMTPVNKPPIALSHDEILAVVAFLNTLGGTTDDAFVDQLRTIQDPWRRGVLQPDEAPDRVTLPVFPGDPGSGAELFDNQGCLRCHLVGPEGQDVGPDLTGIGGSQSAEYLLESTLDPSAVIVKGYMNTIVFWKQSGRLPTRGTPVAWLPDKDRPRTLRLSVLEGEEPVETEIDFADVAQVGDTTANIRIDGEFQTVCGEYVDGDAQVGLTLRLLEDGGWVERYVPPEDIRNINFPSSPMPSNYADLMTPRQIYDLVAYLAEQQG